MKRQNVPKSVKLVYNWAFEHNYMDASNDRIWILWGGDQVNVQILKKNAQFIHCKSLIDALLSLSCNSSIWEKFS